MKGTNFAEIINYIKIEQSGFYLNKIYKSYVADEHINLYYHYKADEFLLIEQKLAEFAQRMEVQRAGVRRVAAERVVEALKTAEVKRDVEVAGQHAFEAKVQKAIAAQKVANELPSYDGVRALFKRPQSSLKKDWVEVVVSPDQEVAEEVQPAPSRCVIS